MKKLRFLDIAFLIFSLILGVSSSHLIGGMLLDTNRILVPIILGGLFLLIVLVYLAILRNYYNKIKDETIVQISVSIFMVSLLFSTYLVNQFF
ncbi:preprotein translocase subunit SecG [Fontibacillus solani]|uniref:Preprotein translocase subunit SecG n=1 Tax=Fontibacillus solani TaxID=1572857 RepID=A0A7W3SXV7_9BACL|nr:hypothetical protein [Fontibacillus solani]MBA9088254.1 preprotein translocase subunit SecG [Fontibacillus solani]